MPKLPDANLLEITKSDAKTINSFRFGVHLYKTSGREIQELTEDACKDRFEFAQRVLESARMASKWSKPQHRVVLARAYYAMYHAARAVVFYSQRGDDFQEHSSLPKYIPKDFPDRDRWENQIKLARLERNKADYDPYPKADRAFAGTAKAVLGSAAEFLSITRRYLSRKGCRL